MTRRQILALGTAAILATAAPVVAHHSWPVDTSKAVTVSGTVTSYEWGNPHVMMGLDVKVANGTIEKWNVGGPWNETSWVSSASRHPVGIPPGPVPAT